MSVKACSGLKVIYVTVAPMAYLEFETEEKLNAAIQKLQSLINKGVLVQMHCKPKEAKENPVIGFYAESYKILDMYQNDIMRTVPELLEKLAEILTEDKNFPSYIPIKHCNCEDFCS